MGAPEEELEGLLAALEKLQRKPHSSSAAAAIRIMYWNLSVGPLPPEFLLKRPERQAVRLKQEKL